MKKVNTKESIVDVAEWQRKCLESEDCSWWLEFRRVLFRSKATTNMGKCIVAIVEDLLAPKIINTIVPLLFALDRKSVV